MEALDQQDKIAAGDNDQRQQLQVNVEVEKCMERRLDHQQDIGKVEIDKGEGFVFEEQAEEDCFVFCFVEPPDKNVKQCTVSNYSEEEQYTQDQADFFRKVDGRWRQELS